MFGKNKAIGRNVLLLGLVIGLLTGLASSLFADTHPDNNILIPGTNSALELSAKGAASDVRSWAQGKVGIEGARLFINNISNPGNVDTIINYHRGNVGIGTNSPTAKLTVVGSGLTVEAKAAGTDAAGWFHTDNPGAIGAALEGSTTSDDGWAGALICVGSNCNGVYILGSSTGAYISVPVGQEGLLVAQGTKSAVVATSHGARALYSEEATEVWFADYGFGRLQGGRSRIRLDPLFAETINPDQPYHVFIQAYGNAELYVSRRTRTAFEVRLREGDPSVEFSYRLVAKRKGYEQTRLERVPFADNDPNLYPEKRAEWQTKLPFHALRKLRR